MDDCRGLPGRLAIFSVGVALALLAVLQVAVVAGTIPDSGLGPRADTAGPTDIVFGAVGDFDNKAPSYPDMVALGKRLENRGGEFLLALGDLGYVADEQQWCGAIKRAVNTTLVVAGNHDTTEDGPGDINNDVVYCPFNVDASLVPGPKYGYGKSYYFDYPAATPLVRVIMISAGTTGTQLSGMNYTVGGADYNWVVAAVNGARSTNIPWVVVGLHKMCITVGTKTACNMGQAMFDKLVGLKVDLILQGHDHVYERSKQLALSAACPSVLSAGLFDPDCVVASGTGFIKGGGSIVVVDGAGGRDLYSVRLDGSDKEIGYFDAVMGSNANTQGKSSGAGPLVIRLNATALEGSTTFCPLGSGDASTGECAAQVGTTFSDRFSISPSASPPALDAVFAFSPSKPVAGQSVSFTASATGGTPPYTFAWTFGDGATAAGAAAAHTYVKAGSYTANLTVSDADSHQAVDSKTVAVAQPIPLTVDFTFSPASPDAGQPVTFVGSVAGGVPPYAYAWQFGDGIAATGPSPVHAYAAAGTYDVNLTVTDSISGRAAVSKALLVSSGAVPGPPSAAFTFTPRWPRPNATVVFDASPSSDPDPNATLQVRWDWTDDGTYDTAWSSDRVATHTYPIPGTFAVRVEVLDHAGLTASAAHPVTVDAGPPSTTAVLAGVRGTQGWYTSNVTVTLEALDAVSGVASIRYRLDGGGWASYSSALLVGSGRHLLEYQSEDLAGNLEAVHSAAIKVDTSAPVIHLSAPTESATSDIVRISWSETDDVAGVVDNGVQVDDGTPTWLALNLTVTLSLSDGVHHLRVIAMDEAGNVASVETSIRVDTNPLSPAGPYAGAPLYLLLGLSVALVGAAGWRRHRRKQRAQRAALRRTRTRGA